MADTTVDSMSFDDWVALSDSDPGEFEIRRLQTLQLFIESLNPKFRDRALLLQREIDWIIRRAPDSNAAQTILWRMVSEHIEFQIEVLRQLNEDIRSFQPPRRIGPTRSP